MQPEGLQGEIRSLNSADAIMDIPTGLLVKAGSGALTTSVPDSAGVPKDDTKNTLVAEYNDKDSVQGTI